MSEVADFEQRFEQMWPVDQWASVNTIAAVSGGADSVAMLRAMHSLRVAAGYDSHRGELIVLHVHHMLRESADEDADFVRDLCQQLGCRFVFRKVNAAELADDAGDGIESAARDLRHKIFLEEVRSNAARYVATAHTADDQAETVLHRILRGTAIRGLAGIPFTRPLDHSATLIRPLLSFRRREIEAYLAELGQAYRTDETNLDTAFTRNRIRHELMPLLARDFNPEVVDALLRLSDHASDAIAAGNEVADYLASKSLIESGPNRIVIDCRKLGDTPSFYRAVFIQDQWKAQQWPEQGIARQHMLRLVELTGEEAPCGPYDFPGGVAVRLTAAGHLILSRTTD